jgi:hypothetical protein
MNDSHFVTADYPRGQSATLTPSVTYSRTGPSKNNRLTPMKTKHGKENQQKHASMKNLCRRLTLAGRQSRHLKK